MEKIKFNVPEGKVIIKVENDDKVVTIGVQDTPGYQEIPDITFIDVSDGIMEKAYAAAILWQANTLLKTQEITPYRMFGYVSGKPLHYYNDNIYLSCLDFGFQSEKTMLAFCAKYHDLLNIYYK